MASQKIKKAVIPVAGLGTRFLPATKAIPKEMIPIIDIPMIQYVVEEAVSAGIKDIIFVTARHKEALENYFDYNYELEDTLQKRKNNALFQLSHSLGDLCNVITVRQKNPMGLGHAILAAAPIIGNEPFAILLGDDLVDSKLPCIGQLIDVYEKEGASVVGVMEVPRQDVSKYGVVGGKMIRSKLMHVTQLVEKPEPDKTPSNMGMPGRYVLSAKIMTYLGQVKPGKNGEIQLTDGLQILAREEKLLAYQFEGTRYDTGDRIGYLDATIEFALRRPDLRDGMKALVKKYFGKI